MESSLQHGRQSDEMIHNSACCCSHNWKWICEIYSEKKERGKCLGAFYFKKVIPGVSIEVSISHQSFLVPFCFLLCGLPHTAYRYEEEDHESIKVQGNLNWGICCGGHLALVYGGEILWHFVTILGVYMGKKWHSWHCHTAFLIQWHFDTEQHVKSSQSSRPITGSF